MTENYGQTIEEHYEQCWGNVATRAKWQRGPSGDLPSDYCVLRFQPTISRKMWTYATSGMSLQSDPSPLELHMFAPSENEEIIELLTAVCHFHRTGQFLGLGHTVNFGRPWWPGSLCDRGLASLPYLDGPSLEWLEYEGYQIRFLWLIPITEAEVNYKKSHGLEALETKMELARFNYLDPFRPSVV